jgi:hypothetical protein
MLIREDLKSLFSKMTEFNMQSNTLKALKDYSEGKLSPENLNPNSDELPTHLGRSVDMRGRISFATSVLIKKFEWTDDEAFNSHTRRTVSKVGKLVTRIFNNNFIHSNGITNNDIEDFCGHMKSIWSGDPCEGMYIEHSVWDSYSSYNYSEAAREEEMGTLGSSCMKHDECENYMEIYTENNISVLTLKEDNDDGLCARALLWEVMTDEGKCIKFMDRIYADEQDVHEPKFIEWARRNNYTRKARQSYSCKDIFVTPNGEKKSLFIYFQVDGFNNDEYPYIDTLSYGVTTEDGNTYLCNDKNIRLIEQFIGETVEDIRYFDSTSGGYSDLEVITLLRVCERGEVTSSRELYGCDTAYVNCWDEDSVMFENAESSCDYAQDNLAYISHNNSWALKSETWDDIITRRTLILKEDRVSWREGYTLKSNLIRINGKLLSKNDCVVVYGTNHKPKVWEQDRISSLDYRQVTDISGLKRFKHECVWFERFGFISKGSKALLKAITKADDLYNDDTQRRTTNKMLTVK